MRELSVVMPVYNAAQWVEETLQKVEHSIQKAKITKYELIIINDGSNDDTEAVIKRLQRENKKISLFSHANSGRFVTRKKGVDQAQYDRILFVDARTWIDENALSFLSKQVQRHPERLVWNAHINVAKKGNIIARFGDVITLLGWRRYFKKPRLVSYGLKDFDYYPKGTGLFCAPKKIIKEAMEWFEANTSDIKNSSDDTLLIRHIAETNKIWISPGYGGTYFARTTLPAFIKHTYDRGKFFVDGFLRPGTRFFYPLIAVIITSFVLALGAWFLLFAQPLVDLAALGAIVFAWLAMVLVIKLLGISYRDTLAFGLLAPLFFVVYLLGIWSAVIRIGILGDKHVIGRVLGKYHPILRGTIREYIIVTLLFMLIVIPATGFVLFHINHQIFSAPGDATAGFLWLDTMSHSLNPLVGHSNDTNYPFGQDIGGWTLVSYATYWFPMRFLSFFIGPISALNILMFYAYTSAGVAMYWLIKRITDKKLLAFYAGCAVAFVPYAMLKSVGHFSYVFSAIFPLCIGCFLSLWQRPSVKKAIILGILVAVPFYTDGYFMLMIVSLCIAFLISGIVFLIIKRRRLKEWLTSFKYVLIAGLAFLILLSPLVMIQKFYGSEINSELQSNRSSIAGEIKTYRSNVGDFILPPQSSAVFSDNDELNSLHAYNNERSNGSENNDFISPFLYIFCTVAGVAVLIRIFMKKKSSLNNIAVKDPDTIVLAVLVCVTGAVLSLAIMFSPEVSIHGIRIPLPGELLIKYNISLWRVLSRLFVLFDVLVVILGSIGIWIATDKIFTKKNKTDVLYFITLTVCAVGTIFFYAQNFPTRPFDFNNGLPKTYYWLRDQKNIKSVAELPNVDPLDTHVGDYATAQIIHQKDLLNIKDPTGIRLNNTLGSIDNPELVNLLRDRGINAVIYRSQSKCVAENQIGKLIHMEHNVPYYDSVKHVGLMVNLCVYGVQKVASDPAFIRFDEGFNPSANAPDQSDVVMQSGANGWMTVTYDDFSTTYKKDVHVSAVINNTGDIGSGWILKNKAGKELASGRFVNKNGTNTSLLDVRLSDTPYLNLVITGKNASKISLAQVYLSNVVASAD